MIQKQYSFNATLWLWDEQSSSWRLVTLPAGISAEIKNRLSVVKQRLWVYSIDSSNWTNRV